MSRRRRLLLVVTTIGAFVIGFMFAWGVFNPEPPAAESPVRTETPAGQDESVAVRSEPNDELVSGAVVDAPEQRSLSMECDDLSGRFVGLYDDRIAIFAGIPHGCHMMLQLRQGTAADLLPFQIAALQRGIVFTDDDELFQIMEGLAAP